MKLLSFPNDSTGRPQPPPPPREDCGGFHTRERMDFPETASASEEAAAVTLRTEAGRELAHERRETMRKFARRLRKSTRNSTFLRREIRQAADGHRSRGEEPKLPTRGTDSRAGGPSG